MQSASRAPGPDGIRNAIYKTAPQAKSDFLYPLVLKVQLNAEEPLAFKGGEAVDILNKLQLPTPPETFRRILLEKWPSNTSSQVGLKPSHFGHPTSYQRLLRKRGTDLASLVVRGFRHVHGALLQYKTR